VLVIFGLLSKYVTADEYWQLRLAILANRYTGFVAFHKLRLILYYVIENDEIVDLLLILFQLLIDGSAYLFGDERHLDGWWCFNSLPEASVGGIMRRLIMSLPTCSWSISYH
jgi:hypothetical protein